GRARSGPRCRPGCPAGPGSTLVPGHEWPCRRGHPRWRLRGRRAYEPGCRPLPRSPVAQAPATCGDSTPAARPTALHSLFPALHDLLAVALAPEACGELMVLERAIANLNPDHSALAPYADLEDRQADVQLE